MAQSGGAGGGAPGGTPASDLLRDSMLRGAARTVWEGVERPTLGKVALHSRIGAGGMGAVYLGVHRTLGQPRAVKVLLASAEAQSPDARERFLREARLAAGLHSPHLVAVFDVDEDPATGHLFLEMEHVRGVSAAQWIRASAGRVSEGDAVTLVLAATRGLAAAHAAGIVHRDVKPANVLVPEGPGGALRLDGAKLADLGLARSEGGGESLTGANVFVGTPGYAAPEQLIDARRATKPADVFGMGATLYACLAGRAPFTGSTTAKTFLRTTQGRFEPLPTVRPGLHPAVAALVARCLDANPARRFADGAALCVALEACLAAIRPSDASVPTRAAPSHALAAEPARRASLSEAPTVSPSPATAFPPAPPIPAPGTPPPPVAAPAVESNPWSPMPAASSAAPPPGIQDPSQTCFVRAEAPPAGADPASPPTFDLPEAPAASATTPAVPSPATPAPSAAPAAYDRTVDEGPAQPPSAGTTRTPSGISGTVASAMPRPGGRLAALVGVLVLVVAAAFVGNLLSRDAPVAKPPAGLPAPVAERRPPLVIAGLPSDVAVLRDGAPFVAAADLPDGAYDVVLRRGPEWVDSSATVRITQGTATLTDQGEWRRAPGRLSFEFLTPGVEVYVGDRRIAADTPLVEGRTKLRLFRGHEWRDQEVEVVVLAGAAVDIREGTWRRVPAHVDLRALGGDVEAWCGDRRLADGDEIPSGPFTVELRRGAAYDVQRVDGVAAPAGRVAIVVPGPWTRRPGTVSFALLPPGVEVLLDGKPLADGAELAQGTYEITLRRGGDAATQRVRVVAGAETKLTEPEWRRLPARVSLAKLTGGVEAFLGDRRLTDGAELPEGRVRLRLVRGREWVPQEVEVELRAGEAAAVAEGRWWRAPGRVRLKVSEGVVATVAGAPLASGAEMAEGRYVVRLSRGEGYTEQTVTVDVPAGGEVEVAESAWVPVAKPGDAGGGVLADLAAWDAADAAARRRAADAVLARIGPGAWSLSGVETFSCGGQTHEVAVFVHAATGLQFSLVPGGTFSMGSPSTEPRRDRDELQHTVTLTRPFLVARTECTQAAWTRVTGENPSRNKTSDAYPVESVSWADCTAFCERAGLALPTEAQWEWACRAGTTTAFSFGDDERAIDAFAVCGKGRIEREAPARALCPVGQRAPNAFGLLDVHGNVAEWCQDGKANYPKEPVADPVTTTPVKVRILRGGAWNEQPSVARSAARSERRPTDRDADVGFRPVLTIPE